MAMADVDSISLALQRSTKVLYSSAWMVVFGLALVFFLHDGDIGGLVMSAGLILASVGIVMRLFGVIQFRIVELVLLTMMLGNMLSGCYFFLLANKVQSIIAYVDLVLFLFVWFLGGVTNGLIIAQRLDRDSTSERIETVGIFLVYPLGIAGSLAFIPLMLISPFPIAILLFCGGVISILAWIFGRSLRQEAARAAMACRV
jgi:hypothetical protein